MGSGGNFMHDSRNDQSDSDMQKAPMVTEDDIVVALKELGVTASDIVLTHSSLKSFGYVAGNVENCEVSSSWHLAISRHEKNTG